MGQPTLLSALFRQIPVPYWMCMVLIVPLALIVTLPSGHYSLAGGSEEKMLFSQLTFGIRRTASKPPTVMLRDTEEKMYLCAYQHKSLTLILLLPMSSISNGEQGIAAVKHQVLENVSPKIFKFEEKLSKGWGGENAYHVAGYRYLLVDVDRHVARASPPGKVTTLTKDSLLALNKLKEEVDLDKNRARWDDPSKETNMEVSIRAKNNAWVIARLVRGKELYVVLEKANETLLYASDAVEKFSNRYCNGAFSLD